MDGKLKEFIANNKFSDDHILELLTKSVEKPPTETEEKVEEEAPIVDAEPEKIDKTVEKDSTVVSKEDLAKIVAKAVAKAMKGKPIPKPAPTKQERLSGKYNSDGWGIVP